MQKPQKNPVTPLHPFLILLFLILFSCFLTYVIPAGSFDRVVDPVSGRTIVVAGSFQHIQQSPTNPLYIPLFFFESLIQSKTATLIFFILIVGGSFEIIMKTSAIEQFFQSLLLHLSQKKHLLIPIYVSLFSILGFTMGLSTASVIFVPIGILSAKLLGFDELIGIGMVVMGVNAGFAAGIFNPFSVGIAQSMAEIPIFSGALLRVILLFCLLLATSWYLLFQSKRLPGAPTEIDQDFSIHKTLSVGQKRVIFTFIITFSIITIGIAKFQWSIPQLAAMLLSCGVLSGILYGFSANEICLHFSNGAKKMTTGVFVIGLASTMRFLLTEGNILDTIANTLTLSNYALPKWATALSMFYGNAILDLFITSGSSHAAVAMPIMVPMGDLAGLSRQMTVLCFQLGDGLVNLCSPLSTTLTGVLAVANLSYQKWIRFFAPLVGIYLLLGTGILFLGLLLGY